MKKNFTKETKIEMINKHLMERKTLKEIAIEYDVRYDTLKLWLKYFKAKGIDGLSDLNSKRRNFDDKFKRKVIKEVIEGKKSIKSTAFKYNIAPSVLRYWIKENI